MDGSQTTPSMWPDWRGGIQWLTTHLQTLSLISPTLIHTSWWRSVCQPATVQERGPGALEWEEGPEKNVSSGMFHNVYCSQIDAKLHGLHVQPQALWTTVHQDGLIWPMPSRLPGLLLRGPMGWSCDIISNSQPMMAEESLFLRVWRVLLFLMIWTAVNYVSSNINVTLVQFIRTWLF